VSLEFHRHCLPPLDIFFSLPSQQFGPTAHSAHRLNFLWSSLTSRRQLPPSASPATAPLFLCRLPPAQWSHLASSPSSPPKMTTPHRLSFLISISCNRCHWSSTSVASLPLTACLPPPYDPIKGVMRAHPLSTALTATLISSSHARNHLPIGAPLLASVERRHVAISVAPPPSGAIGENPDDLFSLSLSYHDNLPSPGATALSHGRESTIN
jgi:hypothetical protein